MKAKKKSRRKRAQKRQQAARGLEVVHSRVAGVDAGSREHWICAPETEEGVPNVRVFGTTTCELEAAAGWLHKQGVQSVAIESTGTYWIPLYDLLEERGIEAVLVDARKLKRVPGRKTDMLDCQWIQKLHACGLLEACFRPSPVIRGQLERNVGIGGPANAESTGLDEYQSSPSRDGSDRSDGNVYSPSHRGGRTRSLTVGPVARSSL